MTLSLENVDKGNSVRLDPLVSLSLSSFLLPERKEEVRKRLSAILPRMAGLQGYLAHWRSKPIALQVG